MHTFKFEHKMSTDERVSHANEQKVQHSQCKRSSLAAGNQRFSHFQIRYLCAKNTANVKKKTDLSPILSSSDKINKLNLCK